MFIGESAGKNPSSNAGDNNTAIGYTALTSLTTGNDNIAIGYASLDSVTSGYGNIGIGGLPSVTTGNNNTGIGYGAGVDATGSNNTFIGSWDQPSTYAIVSSRRYGKRAVIDVLYKWGPKTNYPGDERTTSFIFLLEDGAWKLDDIYTFRGEFVQAESLNQYLRSK